MRLIFQRGFIMTVFAKFLNFAVGWSNKIMFNLMSVGLWDFKDGGP